MDDLIPFDCKYVHHTDRGLCVNIGGQNVWLPISQIELEDVDQMEKGEEIEILVPCWLAEDNGIA